MFSKIKNKNRKEQNLFSTSPKKLNKAIGGKKSAGVVYDEEISSNEDDKGMSFVV